MKTEWVPRREPADRVAERAVVAGPQPAPAHDHHGGDGHEHGEDVAAADHQDAVGRDAAQHDGRAGHEQADGEGADAPTHRRRAGAVLGRTSCITVPSHPVATRTARRRGALPATAVGAPPSPLSPRTCRRSARCVPRPDRAIVCVSGHSRTALSAWCDGVVQRTLHIRGQPAGSSPHRVLGRPVVEPVADRPRPSQTT